MGLRSAVAINVASMIGAGPLITIPLVVVALHGSVSVAAWIAGAVVSLCDGMVNAELASRFPRSGGMYAYLREAFGTSRWGALAAFLFVWQFFFFIPLTLASGYIGFAQYAAYLFPIAAQPVPQHAIAIVVGIVVIIALYRPIPVIARTALILGAIALVTVIVIALVGLTHPVMNLATLVPRAFSFGGFGVAAFGAALVITIYDYAGYNSITEIGDEVVAPVSVIPRAILLSVMFVAVSYVLLNIGVFAALPIAEIGASSSVASLVVERGLGHTAAIGVTIAVLVTAFASTYGLLLGAARIPYAAARDGLFLAPFARLHPTMKFPHISLLVIGAIALPASLFPLDAVINALTAGIVVIAGIGSAVAVSVLRRRTNPPPFRAPFFPLPQVIAGAAWIFLFVSTGPKAMLFGIATLAAGAVVFLFHSYRSRLWPFAAATVALLAFAMLPGSRTPASAEVTAVPRFDHARVVQRDGYPQLLVDGKPFFFFGGAFFYERIPPERWAASMRAMKALGANTLDLYIPWNWHELSDGDFDFDGHTNPRRNLREVLRLAAQFDFKIIVRPGPVIRNEWRNGGYPAWLLTRPEYGMPLHDILEGRYPATATLQNAHSDDAAGEWLSNPTHLRYASRWLHRALAELQPYANRVIAVQLDDDQGAYIDNQTWPAPNFQRYLRWLDGTVRDVVGPTIPTFINTYDMKVPASSPVWAMGNWYQSDMYAIGDHDRQELDFTTATLTTPGRFPLAYSEFQAGWLASPEDPQPRPADPVNTELALGELLSWGSHGVIDFPMQDTLAPFGWEAPFSNALYAWDAAIPRDSEMTLPPGRETPTKMFGAAVKTFGPLLAATRRIAPIAIIYGLSAVDERRLTPAGAAAIVATFRDQLRACTTSGQTCNVIDLRSVTSAELSRYRWVVRPPLPGAIIPSLQAKLRSVKSTAVLSQVPSGHGGDVAFLSGREASFAVASNWTSTIRHIDGRFAAAPNVDLGAISIEPRSSRLIAVDVAFKALGLHAEGRFSTTCPVETTSNDVVASAEKSACAVQVTRGSQRWNARLEVHTAITLLRRRVSRIPAVVPVSVTEPLEPGTGFSMLSSSQTVTLRNMPPERVDGPSNAVAYRAAVFGGGDDAIVMETEHMRVVIEPDAGARVVVLQWLEHDFINSDATNATGALRDDVSVQPPPSTTDRIARYTHSYPAGMFNRPYQTTILEATGKRAVVRCTYDAPDVVPSGARFEKIFTLTAGSPRLIVDERVIFNDGNGASDQRALTLSALAIPPSITPFSAASPAGFAATVNRLTITVEWPAGSVEQATWTPYRSNGTLSIRYAPGSHRTTYALAIGQDSAKAAAFAQAERDWVQQNPKPSAAP